jgi:hypothetical protein
MNRVSTEESVLVAAVDVLADDGYALSDGVGAPVAFLLTLRTWARSRAALQLEVLALWLGVAQFSGPVG